MTSGSPDKWGRGGFRSVGGGGGFMEGIWEGMEGGCFYCLNASKRVQFKRTLPHNEILHCCEHALIVPRGIAILVSIEFEEKKASLVSERSSTRKKK